MPCRRFECIHHTSFRAPDMPMCHFIIDTGVPRGCPAGAGCTRYATKKPEKPRKNSGYKPRFDEEMAYEAYQKGGTDAEIAARVHVSRQTIMAWRNRRRYPVNRTTEREKLPDDDTLMADYNAGLSDPQIAARYNVNTSTVWKWRKRHHLTDNQTRRRNEREKM